MIKQQTKSDLMFRFSLTGCGDMLTALSKLPSHVLVDLHAPVLNVRTARMMVLALELGDEDALVKSERSVVWRMDPELVDELASRFQRAQSEGVFAPAELAIVRGPKKMWLHLYAELVDETQPGGADQRGDVRGTPI